MGKVIGRQPGLFASSPEEVEKALRDEMFEVASPIWELHTVGVMNVARQQVVDDHDVRVQDFMTLVTNNPFVLKVSRFLLARGLHV